MTDQTDLTEFSADDASVSTDTSSVYTDRNSSTPTTRRGDSADDIDPRKLNKSPSANELRWYYRHTFAKTLVDKPVHDAFKNGFEIRGDPNGDIRATLDELNYLKKYKTAQIKARRDGFSLLYYVLRDGSDGTHEPPQNVIDVQSVKVITLDDLARVTGGVPKDRVVDNVSLPPEDFEVRETGLVVNKDPTSPDYNEPIAYVLNYDDDDTHDPTVIHIDRTQHFVWNEEVDGNLDDDTLGEWEGDSVLMPFFHQVKGLTKGNWSLMQTIYRYSAQMYTLNLPDGAGDDAMEDASNAFKNLNAKSELVLPPGYDVDSFGTDGQLDPQPYFDLIFDQICASTEMTKSVLFGTQSGTVSGSETDIKNYFNKVERLRQNRFTNELHEGISLLRKWSRRNLPNEYTLTWNSMFRLSDLDRAEAMRTLANTGQMLVNSFALTPDEVRSLMEQEWAELDVDFDLDELTEEDREDLEWVNFGQRGLENEDPEVTERENHKTSGGGKNEENHKTGNPRKQNGGGMPEGHSTGGSQPNADESTESDRDEPRFDY